MKDKKRFISLIIIVITLFLFFLNFKNKPDYKNLSKQKKLIIIHKKLNKKLKSYNNKEINKERKKLLKKYSISKKTWKEFLNKLSKDEKFIKKILNKI